MADSKQSPSERIVELYSQQKCWMIDDLSQAVGYAVVSVRRYLKQIGYFRSYTHNGKWYTLTTVPVFNKIGVWICESIGFSKHGNLTQTIIHLTDRSDSGYTAKELKGILHYPCHPVLRNMVKAGQIDRIKESTEFSYLSLNRKIHHRQLERLKLLSVSKTAQPLTAEAAVFILVEFIKNPDLSLKEMAKKLKQGKRIVVAPNEIERFFINQGLKKIPPETIRGY
jgi:hypothetical protein